MCDIFDSEILNLVSISITIQSILNIWSRPKFHFVPIQKTGEQHDHTSTTSRKYLLSRTHYKDECDREKGIQLYVSASEAVRSCDVFFFGVPRCAAGKTHHHHKPWQMKNNTDIAEIWNFRAKNPAIWIWYEKSDKVGLFWMSPTTTLTCSLFCAKQLIFF